MKQYKISGTKFFLSRLTQFRKFLLIFLRLDKGKLWGGNLNYQTSQIVRVFRLFEHFVCIDIENYIEQRAVHLYWPWVEKENIVELCLISLRKLFTSTCFLGLSTNTAWHIFVRITFFFLKMKAWQIWGKCNYLGWHVRSRIVWCCFRWSHLICLTLKGLRGPRGTLSSNGLHQVYLKWKMKIIGGDCRRNVKTIY